MLKDSLNTNAHYAIDIMHLHTGIMHSHTSYTQFHIAKVLAFKLQLAFKVANSRIKLECNKNAKQVPKKGSK
jgi:hypothetical protein